MEGKPEGGEITGETSIPAWETDFILVYQKAKENNSKDEELKYKRQKFLELLKKENFKSETVEIGEKVYIKLRCSFERLCQEAERVKLEMPLTKGKVLESHKTFPNLSKWIEDKFGTDKEGDYISAPFFVKQLKTFKGHENQDTFFRRSLRSLLTYHILITLDVCIENVEDEDSSYCCFCCTITQSNSSTKSEQITLTILPESDERTEHSDIGSTPFANDDTNGLITDNESQLSNTLVEKFNGSGDTCAETEQKTEEDDCRAPSRMKGRNLRGLRYFLLKNIFKDAFTLHEDKEMFDTEKSNSKAKQDSEKSDLPKTNNDKSKTDLVQEMEETWTVFYKFQPLWKVRNYFGEKIAFYFAWVGMLISWLWLPTILGFGVFLYGLVLTAQESEEVFQSKENETTTEQIVSKISALLHVIRYSFDNAATPFFTMALCLWGTLFLEAWKRKSARLAYEWDVNDFQASEPDRPEFTGSKTKHDPVTDKSMWYYPLKKQLVRFAASCSAVIFMICLVIISLMGVIVYRVIISVSECPAFNGAECLLLTTIVSALLNAISIVLLGRFYNNLAVWLTDWENHQTQSKYDDALVIKMFAFQFVNSFASCFYIAFFIERVDTASIIGRGDQYRDSCQGTCMSQLSFQVMVLMFVKPFPKFFMDIIMPFLRHVWRRLSCRKNKISPKTHFLKRERLKPRLNEFTLGEYTEKVIQYGFLMLFAASFPLAPLLALITNLIDIRVDAKRLLRFYRRPVAFIAQNIGIWYQLLTFVNFCGVLSNAFLVAFTSTWGQRYDITGKLVIVIGFEHIVFFLKYVLAYLIPDVPVDVQLAMRREKYQTSLLFV